ncbi:MAG TPA: GAF domain-containing protein, partial [Blastocatellia bacterium]|nr:GAF domain-containing protein [Blastocatellia bacterium]
GQPEAVEYEYRLPEVASVKGTAFREDLLNRVMAASANGGPILIEDSRRRSLLGPEAVNALNVYSEMALPVKVEGQTRALIYLHQCDAAREWQPSEVEFAMRVGQQLSLSLGNARAFESLTHEAEAAKEEARRSKEARTRAQAIIEALPEPLIAVDAEGRLALYNLTARDRLGLRNEDVGRPVAALEQLATQDDTLWKRVLSCEGLTHFTGQIARAGAAANPLPVSIAVTPMRNERGNLSGHLILLSDISHVSESPERGREFEQRLAEARATIERLQPLVNEARAAAEEARRKEMEIRKERDQLREDQARVARSAQQLIEINRLKSEFIVNAGHEIEGPLQALLGLADQLEQGNYGQLTQEQLPVVQGIKEWARRLQEDVNSLIEYGSTRSRRENGT